MSDGEKRRMSSDGQTTLKPSSKMFKMADVNNDPKAKDVEAKMIDKMPLISESVRDLRKVNKNYVRRLIANWINFEKNL